MNRMTLRLRPDVHEAVRLSAERNYRSVTAEINELLYEATVRSPSLSDSLAGGKAVGSTPACQKLASGYQPEANHNALTRSEP